MTLKTQLLDAMTDNGVDGFTLHIELGNAAMETGGDVADALRKVADRIDTRRGGSDDDGPIMDENGNTVGGFSFGGFIYD